jgi:endoglucanase
MNKRALEKTLETIMSQPTAPFHEYHVRGAIQAALKGVKGVKLMQDSFGNLIAHYKKGRAKAKWALGAHMDHPGWVRTKDGGSVFLGGVPESYRAENMDKIVWHGGFGVWDVPTFERWNGSVVARACDDLAGCAIAVTVIQEMARRQLDGNFYALFTRAEEVGFVGIHRMLEEGAFPADVTFLCLETSAMVEGAKKDGGPVIRVGDRLSSFTNEAVAALESTAKEHKIDCQRLLLDRGACEASAVMAHGLPACGISLLLENYHNCGPGNTILPEKIEVEDVARAVKLVLSLLGAPPPLPAGKKLLDRVRSLDAQNALHEAAAREFWPK